MSAPVQLATASSHAQAWDTAARGWNQYTALIYSWLRESTQAMLDMADIRSGSRVLDIAAGTGEQTLQVAARVGVNGYVLATDVSEAILAFAQQRFREHQLRHVNTRVADAQALGLEGADFDAAICRLGLMFCRDPLRALVEIRKALRPGGRFSGLVFSHARQNPCLTIVIAGAMKHAGLPDQPLDAAGTLLSLGAPGLLDRLLGQAGFGKIDVYPVYAPFRLRSSKDYVDFVRASASPIMALIEPLSQAAQRDAWDDIEQQLNIFNTATGWVGPNELLIFAATA